MTVNKNILDVILIFSKCSKMTECHRFDSLKAWSNLRESLNENSIVPNIRVKLVFWWTRVSLKWNFEFNILCRTEAKFFA